MMRYGHSCRGRSFVYPSAASRSAGRFDRGGCLMNTESPGANIGLKRMRLLGLAL